MLLGSSLYAGMKVTVVVAGAFLFFIIMRIAARFLIDGREVLAVGAHAESSLVSLVSGQGSRENIQLAGTVVMTVGELGGNVRRLSCRGLNVILFAGGTDTVTV